MMRKRIVYTTCTLAMLVACTANKKLGYEFPEAMLPHVKEGYRERCNKGQVLYNINCAGCHNVKVKGRSVVPDFKPEDLRGYELRVANPRHESSMPDSLVTEEELGIIMVFLQYKEKSGVTRNKDRNH